MIVTVSSQSHVDGMTAELLEELDKIYINITNDISANNGIVRQEIQNWAGQTLHFLEFGIFMMFLITGRFLTNKKEVLDWKQFVAINFNLEPRHFVDQIQPQILQMSSGHSSSSSMPPPPTRRPPR